MSSLVLQKVEFLWNNFVCQLQVKNEHLHIWCVKKLNPLNPRPLSVFNKCISVLDIVSVNHGSDVWKVDKEKSLLQCNMKNLLKTSVSSCCSLSININTSKNRLRKMQTIKLLTGKEKECKGWQEFILSQQQLILDKYKIVRPKHLLVFINPYGGRKKAVSIHANVVSPLFKLAGIKETAIVTERRNHAKDYVETTDLSAYDGIIAVGGDGMVNEIMNGILIAAQNSSNIPIHDDTKTLHQKPLDFVPAKPKIGLIPAGSTNCLSFATQGIDDPETAAMHIICGENHSLDVCSIHDDNGKFIRFSFSMTSYGYFGQVLKKSENLRKLGPTRYDVAGVSAFTQMQSYSSEVTYFLSSPDISHFVAQDHSRCRYPCKTCLKSSATSTLDDEALVISKCDTTVSSDVVPSCAKDLSINDQNACEQSSKLLTEVIDKQCKNPENLSAANDRWKVARGNFVMINSAMMSCTCARCPEGLSPSAHLSDGNLDLILLRCTSKADLLRYLLAHVGKANRFNFPFVEVHRVKGFRHKALSRDDTPTSSNHLQSNCIGQPNGVHPTSPDGTSQGCWNTDGEIIENPNITVWAHHGLINLFARGVE